MSCFSFFSIRVRKVDSEKHFKQTAEAGFKTKVCTRHHRRLCLPWQTRLIQLDPAPRTDCRDARKATRKHRRWHRGCLFTELHSAGKHPLECILKKEKTISWIKVDLPLIFSTQSPFLHSRLRLRNKRLRPSEHFLTSIRVSVSVCVSALCVSHLLIPCVSVCELVHFSQPSLLR